MKWRLPILLLLLASMKLVFAAEIRFVIVDVLIDPGSESLAAYQLEIAAPAGTKFVGIEGGEHPEFRKAPYYDPKAMQSERLIVAAFSVAPDAKLPRERTRILTLHLQTASSDTAKLEPQLKLAAKPNGQKI